jgi:co-chaperonin GroES (HSP10)
MRGAESKINTDTDRIGFGAVASGAAIRPIADKVVVLQDDYGDPEELSEGGIFVGGLRVELPDELRGTVEAVGPRAFGARNGKRAIDLEPGSRVMWPRACGTLLERLPGERRQRLVIKYEFLDFEVTE